MSTPTRDPARPWYSVADEAHRALILKHYATFGALSPAFAAYLGIGHRTLYRECERLGLTHDVLSAVTKSVTSADAVGPELSPLASVRNSDGTGHVRGKNGVRTAGAVPKSVTGGG